MSTFDERWADPFWHEECVECGHRRMDHYWEGTAPEWLKERASGDTLIGREQRARPMEEGWCWFDRYEYRATCDCRGFVAPGGVVKVDVTYWPGDGSVTVHTHRTKVGDDHPRTVVLLDFQERDLRSALDTALADVVGSVTTRTENP